MFQKYLGLIMVYYTLKEKKNRVQKDEKNKFLAIN